MSVLHKLIYVCSNGKEQASKEDQETVLDVLEEQREPGHGEGHRQSSRSMYSSGEQPAGGACTDTQVQGCATCNRKQTQGDRCPAQSRPTQSSLPTEK